MTRNETICDRCGKAQTIRTKNDIIISFAKIDLWQVGQHRTDAPQRIDLCTECYEKFVNFLEGWSDPAIKKVGTGGKSNERAE